MESLTRITPNQGTVLLAGYIKYNDCTSAKVLDSPLRMGVSISIWMCAGISSIYVHTSMHMYSNMKRIVK